MKSCNTFEFLVLSLAAALLTGCGGDGGILKNLSSLNPSPVGDSKVPTSVVPVEEAQCPAEKASGRSLAFQTDRVFHHPSTLNGLRTFTAAATTVSTSEEFVALKKNHCDLGAEWLEAVTITHQPPVHSTMKRHAFSFQLKKSLTVDEFEQISASERCLLSISSASKDEKPLAASDWTSSDPNTTDQAWIRDIRLAESLDEFFHPDYGIKQDVVIADIDTGVYFFHEDLQEQMLWKQSNGLIGYNVLNPGQDAQDDLTSGGGQAVHGSKIAGIIGAVSGNNKGIIGMFPRNIKVMAVKYISSSGGAQSADRINGFEYAVANGAEVINLSIGFSNNEVTFRQMIEDFVANGGFVATSAGNDGSLVSNSAGRYPVVWAKDIDGMMSVGGTQSGSDTIWSGSNYGTATVEIAAPGGSVFTTIPWNPGSSQFGNFYGSTSGTSFSSPMVAGAAGMVIGLLKSNNIAFTAKDVEDLISSGSRQVPSLESRFMGGRVLDMEKLAAAVHEMYPQIKNGGGVTPPVPVVCP